MKDTLFIIDLDGMTLDSSKRFEKATKDGKIDWAVAFDPALLSSTRSSQELTTQ